MATEDNTAEYDITVKIRVRVSNPTTPYDNPNVIAAAYRDMATKYRSIGAVAAEVVEVKKVEQ